MDLIPIAREDAALNPLEPRKSLLYLQLITTEERKC